MSRINTRTAATAFGAGLLLSALATQPVFAAEPVAEPVVQQTVVEDIRPDGPPIRINLGSGTVIRLPRGARSAFIADPAIADIHVSSPTSILLFPKKGGDTVLYVEGVDGDDVMLNTIVRVRPLEVQVLRPEKEKGTAKETSISTRQATTITSRAGGVTTSTTKSTTEMGSTE